VGTAAPGTAVGYSSFVGLALERDGLLSPSARLALVRHVGGTVSNAIGDARFVWTAGRLDACPIRFAVAPRVWLEPCLNTEIGTVAASSSVAHPSSRVRPWVAAGALGRVEWRVLEHLALEAGGGASAPFTREDFYFEPDVTVYTPPPVMLSGEIGAAAIFP
jgi:hypothetical protein